MDKVVPLFKPFNSIFYSDFSSMESLSFSQIDSNFFENFRIIAKCHCSVGPTHASQPVPAHEIGPPPFSSPVRATCARPSTASVAPASCCWSAPIAHERAVPGPPSPTPRGTSTVGPPISLTTVDQGCHRELYPHPPIFTSGSTAPTT
jgi:hypothetical protein